MPRPRFAALPWALPLALALAGCGSMSVSSLWPFGDSEIQEKDRRPANATEYRCSDGKAFYVRNLEGGAVWLIAPDRDVRLEKLSDGRYGVGRVSLELSANEATLTDPPSMYVNCKRAG
jgi:hypothetical protein